jgi:cation diffusion facilitator CzcD-associated flavoprotein CzcO
MEHLDVVVVGAGLSGIGAGHYLQERCPWASYAILEARGAIGGTWDLFRYPGVRSDSDMYTLGYSFRPWPGERTMAGGPAILDYIEETAREEGIDKHLRFHHRVVAANWSTTDACWHLTVERGDTGERLAMSCSFLYACAGYYRYDHGYLPDFAGMADFTGTLVHPQAWPEDLDYAGKRVVVIGSGATAVTLVPALAEKAAQVTMLQRSPTYIASVPGRNPVAPVLRHLLPRRLSGPAIRWFHALFTQGSYHLSKRRPELMKRFLAAGVKRELPPGFDIATHFTPTYNPWDQRLCAAPDGDFFRAIRRGTASVVTDTIERFTPTGIRLSSGAELEADIVVTATGLEMLFVGGMALSVDGDPVDSSTRMVYKGMMLEDVPNFAFAIGYTNASWTLKCELSSQYVCRLLNHLHMAGLRVATPDAHGTEPTGETVMGLNSGYIQRAAHMLPRQGPGFPWRVYQSYPRDFRAMRMSKVDDGVMSFA